MINCNNPANNTPIDGSGTGIIPGGDRSGNPGSAFTRTGVQPCDQGLIRAAIGTDSGARAQARTCRSRQSFIEEFDSIHHTPNCLNNSMGTVEFTYVDPAKIDENSTEFIFDTGTFYCNDEDNQLNYYFGP